MGCRDGADQLSPATKKANAKKAEKEDKKESKSSPLSDHDAGDGQDSKIVFTIARPAIIGTAISMP